MEVSDAIVEVSETTPVTNPPKMIVKVTYTPEESEGEVATFHSPQAESNFVSDYFGSINCMREMKEAVELQLPILLVVETDPQVTMR